MALQILKKRNTNLHSEKFLSRLIPNSKCMLHNTNILLLIMYHRRLMFRFVFSSRLLCALLALYLTSPGATNIVAQESSQNSSEDKIPNTEPKPEIIDDSNTNEADVTAFRQTLETLNKSLWEREVEYGPYHPGIANTLLEIAHIQSELEEHKEARNNIMRALEVQRISEGLYGAGQIPIIQQLIQANRTLEKWSDVDKNYELLYWLHRRLHGENSVKLMPNLQLFVDWKIEAINGGLFGRRQKLIRQALTATKQAISIIRSAPELEYLLAFYLQLEKDLREEDRAETAKNTSGF